MRKVFFTYKSTHKMLEVQAALARLNFPTLTVDYVDGVWEFATETDHSRAEGATLAKLVQALIHLYGSH